MDATLLGSLIALVGFTGIVITVIAFYILLVVADWKIFTKAGEAGWKSLIPVYNFYVQCKITWNTKMFWVWLLVNALMAGFGANSDITACSIIAGIFAIAVFVMYILINNKLAKAFGHGVGYTILIILFPNIMTLILGFGKDEYQGPQ